MRKQAICVEPTSNADWNTPADVSEAEARQLLMEAVNDYSGRYNHLDVKELLDQLTGLETVNSRPRVY
jgi:hypothetical protein